jgi:hypothetical protein
MAQMVHSLCIRIREVSEVNNTKVIFTVVEGEDTTTIIGTKIPPTIGTPTQTDGTIKEHLHQNGGKVVRINRIRCKEILAKRGRPKILGISDHPTYTCNPSVPIPQ